jgi:diguanylate cyclase (GGDEF)-like protein
MPEEESRMLKAAKTGKSYHAEDEVLWRKDGTSFPAEYHSTPIYRTDELIGAVVTFHDISERREAEQQIRHMAFHDALTHLPNRRLFMDRLEQQLTQIRRYGHQVALHLLDLDHFKDINDRYGHLVGDGVLEEVTEIVSKANRSADIFARYGGEEFIILTPETGIDGAMTHAERLRKDIDKHSFSNVGHVTSSFGVAEFDPEKDDLESLLDRADKALYIAKEDGRNRVEQA